MDPIRKDPNNWDFLDKFRPITLLNTELKILARVLTKRLVRVKDGLIGDAQICVVHGRSFQDYLLRYTLEAFNSKSGEGRTLVHLNQPNAFD